MRSKHGFGNVSRFLNIKLIYHVIMILLVTHDDREKNIEYLRSHPKELPTLFRIKVKEANLNFSDHFPQTIDLQMIRELCDEIENHSADEDYRNLMNLVCPQMYDMDKSLVMELANIQADETIWNADFSYSYLLISILENNNEQVVFEKAEDIFYDFMLATVYLKDAPNVHLYYEHGINEVKRQFDKAVAAFSIDTLTLRIFYPDDFRKYVPSPHDNFYKDYESIGTSMNKLKSDGCGFFSVSADCLAFNNSIKNELVNKNWVETVIQLGKTEYRRRPAILILNKNKKTKKIRFIDASEFDFCYKSSSEINPIKKRIIDAVHRKTNYAGFVRNVDVDEVVDRNYNLLPINYVNTVKVVNPYPINGRSERIDLTELNSIETVRLGEIVKISENFVPFTISKYGKSYRIRNGTFDWKHTGRYRTLHGFSPDVNLVKKSDILVRIHYDTWRISYVDKDKDDTIYDGITLRVTDARFDSEWLSRYLKSPIAHEQYLVGKNNLNEVDKKALLNIKIPRIPLKRQISALKNYQKKINIIKATRQELWKELNESQLELYSEMNLDQFFR
ncbi:N-6 DNA methylase [Companilactobacillus sp. HBUAS59699]|uniref:N-6 DNA methylase n=1 Tax=Companilactobacillus sp. HBUAS59699 TaxID=3109358 RepID=UPI002FEEDA4F